MHRFPLFAVAAVLFAAPSIRAQEPQPPPPHARRGPGDFQQLGLTEDQKQKIREIRQQYAHDPEARRKAVLEVLTPEQRDKLKEMRRHRRELGRAPQPPPPPPQP